MTIKQKQWQLWYLGYYTGALDGIWGPLSRQAAQSCQSHSGLDADGIFGPLTEADCAQVITGIQELLGIPADGLAGEQTRAATARWQAEQGLTADGIAGPLTRQAMTHAQAYWSDITHFTPEEFACKCGGRHCAGWPAMVRKPLLRTADKVRQHFGAAAVVSSGLRCPGHNAAVGGVPGSRHLLGKAVDLRVAGRSARQVLEFVGRLPEIRYCYAIDSNYVHMDIL